MCRIGRGKKKAHLSVSNKFRGLYPAEDSPLVLNLLYLEKVSPVSFLHICKGTMPFFKLQRHILQFVA